MFGPNKVKCASPCEMWEVDLPSIVGEGLDAPGIVLWSWCISCVVWPGAQGNHLSIQHLSYSLIFLYTDSCNVDSNM